MSVVIGYQSMNSNSSYTHNLSASTAQPHTRMAHETMQNIYIEDDGMLRYATDTEIEPNIPMEGPPEKISLGDVSDIDKLKKDIDKLKKGVKRRRKTTKTDDNPRPKKKRKIEERVLSMVEGKARQFNQCAIRVASQQPCDVLVFGELDSSNSDWGELCAGAGNCLYNSIQSRTCNSFSMHSTILSVSNVIDEGVGWFAAEVKGVVAVFLHVPNSICDKATKAQVFYSEINNKLLRNGGKVVDVFIGDTNQPNDTFSPKVISKAMNMQFKNALKSGVGIELIDAYSSKRVKHVGTNSVNTKMFDVAVYNTETVKSINVSYVSPMSFMSNKAQAFTDHMGMIVQIEKK